MLENKIILVTGAAGGIGQATCRVLIAEGARVVMSDLTGEASEAAHRAMRDIDAGVDFIPADLGSEGEIEALIARIVERHGRLDGAFNNAGVEQRNKLLADLSLEEWDHAIRIDLTSVFLCMKHQIRAMLKTGGGAIVSTSSSLGQVGTSGASEYIAAKHGVVGLTRAAGADYGPKGIRVNAVLPGITRTPMVERLSGDPQLAEQFDRMRKRHSMHRFGEAQEVGHAVAWLLSDFASFMNGAAVPVDGGYLST